MLHLGRAPLPAEVPQRLRHDGPQDAVIQPRGGVCKRWWSQGASSCRGPSRPGAASRPAVRGTRGFRSGRQHPLRDHMREDLPHLRRPLRGPGPGRRVRPGLPRREAARQRQGPQRGHVPAALRSRGSAGGGHLERHRAPVPPGPLPLGWVAEHPPPPAQRTRAGLSAADRALVRRPRHARIAALAAHGQRLLQASALGFEGQPAGG
mmetsp:Transcript_98727/g.294825  ORF Transcript_98727/g.294825 Transcript_98727/m.294825 type:complete len:207 (+) Transcript_98727:943-1563(+)